MTTKITEQNISNLANAGVDWQSVKTGNFTAVAGEGYFVNTTSAAITVTLPASPSAGDVIVLKDYARTWGTNKVSLASALLDGATDTTNFNTNGQTVTLVYMDGTKGWSLINEDTTNKLELPTIYTSATGGAITTSGDYKIHTFTGDGSFIVSSVGNSADNPLGGPNTVSYLVIAGGGSGGSRDRGGGGGAGGFREGRDIGPSYTASPLVAPSGLTITATTYPVTVGAGASANAPSSRGNQGSPSSFSTITSAGGGAGGGDTPDSVPTLAGGSGGGRGVGAIGPGPVEPGGAGNTPPVSPPQGNNGGGGQHVVNGGSGGGGGAGAVGGNGDGNVPGTGGAGGAGATTSITGSPVTRAGGGGGGGDSGPRPGGSGGGGAALPGGGPGTANTGGGGGGTDTNGGTAGAGGKGIVIIRYKFQ
jgi:hypothetical protein